MSEKTQRRKIVKALKPLAAFPIENSARPGTPDVGFVGGLMELKWRRAWPTQDGVVKIAHFTVQQRRFLREFCRAGGRAWLLLQVQREWLLFDGESAAEYVGFLSRQGLIRVSARYWKSGLKAPELVRCLKS